MGDFHEEDRLYAAYNDRTLNHSTSTTGAGSILLAVAAGLYFFVKVLELAGFPVWLWAHMVLEKLSTLWAQSVGSTGNGVEGADTPESAMQRGGSMLGSVFGLNSSSFLQKSVQGVTGTLAKGSSDVPPGLGNWDNSCYQNSVIQGLASLPTLRDYLSNTTGTFRSLDVETTNGALFDMIRKLNDPENHGQHYWVRGKLKNMSTFQQQDAQEYYSKILDALDKEVQSATNIKRRSTTSWLGVAMSLSGLNVDNEGGEQVTVENEADNANPPQNTHKIAQNPLDGLLAQRVGCIQCGYSEGLQLIPFNCMTVSLGRGYAYDICDCLDEYTHLEYIEGVECAKCTLLKLKTTLAPLVAGGAPFGAKLQAVEDALEDDDFDDKTLVKKFNIMKKNWVQSTKSRQAVIARAPKALVLHVNRSIFDEMTGAQYKNTAAVTYPQILDLGNWCLGSRPSNSHLPDNNEEWPKDPTKSMIGDMHTESSIDSPFQYQLRAAVTHFGNHNNGHYICYRPHLKKPELPSKPQDAEEEAVYEQWWRFSDDSVSAISETQAHQGNVFMLFYELANESNSASLRHRKAVESTFPTKEDIPLPPTDFDYSFNVAIDYTAINIPLPDDDDESLPDLVASPDAPTPPAAASPPSTLEHRPVILPDGKIPDVDTSAYPTPPPDSPQIAQQFHTEQLKTDSSDIPSMRGSSHNEALPSATTLRSKIPSSPHFMRTAGQSSGRSEGSRRTLPMVTAT
jgi:ubiquitin carboxyl-terminal hydrolase 1